MAPKKIASPIFFSTTQFSIVVAVVVVVDDVVGQRRLLYAWGSKYLNIDINVIFLLEVDIIIWYLTKK